MADDNLVSKRILLNMAINHEEEMHRHKGEKPMSCASDFKREVKSRYYLYLSIHEEMKI